MATRLWLSGDWSQLATLWNELPTLDDVEIVDNMATAEVVVHSATTGSYRDELAMVREHTHAPILLLAHGRDAELLELAVDVDLADVLILPQPAPAVAFAARKLAALVSSRRSRSGRAQVATVFSPKGGTGKSVIACNLAVALAAAGRRTLLVDLDLQFGDVAIMLGLEPQRTLYDLLATPGSLDAEKIGGYATSYGTHGLDVLAAPVRPEDAESIGEARVAELLDAARDGYEVIVVDTAPFFHGPVLTALDRTDELLLVCAPDVPSMKNVRLTLQTLELLSFPVDRIRVILNRANARVGFRAAQVASVLERNVEFELPEDDAVCIAVNRGVPVSRQRAESPFARALEGVAAALRGEHPAANEPRGRRRLAFRRGA
jgi:pilus assembly protein CpaE